MCGVGNLVSHFSRPFRLAVTSSWMQIRKAKPRGLPGGRLIGRLLTPTKQSTSTRRPVMLFLRSCFISNAVTVAATSADIVPTITRMYQKMKQSLRPPPRNSQYSLLSSLYQVPFLNSPYFSSLL